MVKELLQDIYHAYRLYGQVVLDLQQHLGPDFPSLSYVVVKHNCVT